MKTQNKNISHKTSARVWVNTVLLLVATIIAGVISFESCKFVQEGVYKQFSPTSDYYYLCTHETAEDDGMEKIVTFATRMVQPPTLMLLVYISITKLLSLLK